MGAADLKERGWYAVAQTAALLGQTVTVLDPEAELPVEVLWDQIDGHGIITVVAAPTSTGWHIHIAEELIELSADAIATLEELSETVGDEG
jgi:hypothetical protein